jgi:hypothetical protein
MTNRRHQPTRKLIVDPLPQSVLHQMVADLPGPEDETDAARTARFAAQLAEVLSFDPRNSAEAMLATQCVMLRLLAEHDHRDARDSNPTQAKKLRRSAKNFEKLVADMMQALARFQVLPPGTPDPAIFVAAGLAEFIIPEPAQDPEDDDEEAFSAVIVPLHPAPETLQ